MIHDRGLAAPTVLRYENLARRFLKERTAAVGLRFVEDLTGADVVAFLLAETARKTQDCLHKSRRDGCVLGFLVLMSYSLIKLHD